MTQPKSVVLVIDKYSQDAHLAYLTAGVKYPVKYNYQNQTIEYTKEFFSILADLSNIEVGTRVFFYRRRIDEPSYQRGFLGEWKVDTLPYEDLSTHLAYNDSVILGSCPKCRCPVSKLEEREPWCEGCKATLQGHILPLRFALQPLRIYPKYLDDNTAYIDITDQGRLSTLIFRKIYGAGRERSINPILPEESEKLTRLLAKQASSPYASPVQIPIPILHHRLLLNPTPITHYLDFKTQYNFSRWGRSHLYNAEGKLLYETILEFWLIHNLTQRGEQMLRVFDIPCNETIEWFSNQVLFGIGGEKSDVLVLTRDDTGCRVRAIVIELKRQSITAETISQVNTYAYWIAQMATSGVMYASQTRVRNPFTITPIAIGFKLSRNIPSFPNFTFQIPYSQPLTVDVETPRLYTYTINSSANTLELKRIR
ncbi:MAG: hypothetical protein KatS3mg020_0273 [Fimbriimonadales bacterium]|nr:MAG: hypothetical protein KatS3mg020_0273 [Fimbriimonadales bacterium]